MVAQVTLDHLVWVRILVPQPAPYPEGYGVFLCFDVVVSASMSLFLLRCSYFTACFALMNDE